MAKNRRSNKRAYGEPHRPLETAALMGYRTTVIRGGEEWTVQQISKHEKQYICPGCQNIIPPNTEHVVAWANDSIMGKDAALADRRHWHKHCWKVG